MDNLIFSRHQFIDLIASSSNSSFIVKFLSNIELTSKLLPYISVLKIRSEFLIDSANCLFASIPNTNVQDAIPMDLAIHLSSPISSHGNLKLSLIYFYLKV